MKTKPVILTTILAVCAVAVVMAMIALPERLPNDGYTGEMRVSSVVLFQTPRDDQWVIEVDPIPTPAKSEPYEIMVSQEERDYLVRGDILTMQDGMITDVRYMDHTDTPGGERREKVMTPYSEWTPEQMERERYESH